MSQRTDVLREEIKDCPTLKRDFIFYVLDLIDEWGNFTSVTSEHALALQKRIEKTEKEVRDLRYFLGLKGRDDQ